MMLMWSDKQLNTLEFHNNTPLTELLHTWKELLAVHHKRWLKKTHHSQKLNVKDVISTLFMRLLRVLNQLLNQLLSTYCIVTRGEKFKEQLKDYNSHWNSQYKTWFLARHWTCPNAEPHPFMCGEAVFMFKLQEVQGSSGKIWRWWTAIIAEVKLVCLIIMFSQLLSLHVVANCIPLCCSACCTWVIHNSSQAMTRQLLGKVQAWQHTQP